MDPRKYLYKRNVKGKLSPAWHLRIPVPRRHQKRLGKKEVTKSLRTSDQRQAEREAVKFVGALFQAWDDFDRAGPAAVIDLKKLAVDRAYSQMLEKLEESLTRAPDESESWAIYRKRHDEEREKFLRMFNRRDTSFADLPARNIAQNNCPELLLDPSQFNEFRGYVAEGILAAMDVIHRRVSGDIAAQPRSPLVNGVLETATSAAAPGETLLELFERYAKVRVMEGRRRANGIDQDRMVVRLFSEFVGKSKAPKSITVADARNFRDTVADLPPNFAKMGAYQSLPIVKAAEKARANNASRLSPITVARYISNVSPFFDWLRSDGYIDIQPFDGLHQKPVRGQNPRPPVSNEALSEVLRSPLFVGCAGDREEHIPGEQLVDDWRRWVPLLCLFTGCRAGEAAQLRVDDVYGENGGTLIRFKHDPARGQATKSGRSRVIPVHRLLAQSGFVAFCDKQRLRAASDNDMRLFPDMKCGARGDWGARPSRFWRDYLVRVGIKAEDSADGLGLHSFRHRMADELRRAGFLDAQFGPLILGHGVAEASARTTAGYGAVPQGTVVQLRSMIDEVRFEGVDFSPIVVNARG